MRSLILALVLTLAPTAHANYLMLALPTLVTVTQNSIRVLPQNGNRTYLAINNAGPSTAWIQFGTITQFAGQAHTLAYQGFPVISGETIKFPTPAPNNSAYGDSPGTAALTIIEGQ